MKKILILVLTLVMILAMFCACQKEEGTAATKATDKSTKETSESSGNSTENTAADPENPWAGLDTSKEVHSVIYVLGTAPTDLNEVMDICNKRTKEMINTTFEVNFIPLADFATKYPLVLTGGDDIDLVYTSSWCFFSEQSSKGAFMEITDDFVKANMPVTYVEQVPASWNQIKNQDGKIFAIPRNETAQQLYGGYIIRKDLREKYNMDEIKNFDELEQYLFAVAENEAGTGIYALYTYPSCPMKGMLMDPFENFLYAVSDLVWDADNKTFDPEDLRYIYETEEYKNYVLKMAEWAKKGVWPTTAMSNTTMTNDLIVEGKSACAAVRTVEAEKILANGIANGYDLEFFTLLTENSVGRENAYSGDAMAIAAFSKNPERSATLLDMLKNDYEVYMLTQGGIEDRHYIINDDGTRSNGPESEDYGWSSWAWSTRSYFQPKLQHAYPILAETEAFYDTVVVDYDVFPYAGFSVDNSPYSAEYAVISSIEGEYEYSFDLGVYGDETEATLEKFISQLKDAGLDKVVSYWKETCKKHYDDYMATKGN